MRPLILAAFAVVVVLGCTPDRPKLPSLPAAFSTLPLPPLPEYLGQSGSEDALMFTFRSAVAADTVAAYYTRLFAEDPKYRVVSTNAGMEGEHAYYVEYAGRPLWVRVRPEAGHQGTIVELTGAVVAPADTSHRSTRDTTRHISGNPRP